MKIAWITFGQVEQREGVYASPLASARYRAIIPGRELVARGHEIRIAAVTGKHEPPGIHSLLRAEVVVFSKSFDSINEELAKAAKRYGAKVVFDICDNHFENPRYEGHYRNMTELADVVVVNTPQMAEIVHQFTGRESTVVGDPYEGPRGEPRWGGAKWRTSQAALVRSSSKPGHAEFGDRRPAADRPNGSTGASHRHHTGWQHQIGLRDVHATTWWYFNATVHSVDTRGHVACSGGNTSGCHTIVYGFLQQNREEPQPDYRIAMGGPFCCSESSAFL